MRGSGRMKEIRGMDAVRYAEKECLLFNVDESYLIKAEGELLGRPASLSDVEAIFNEKLGRSYSSTLQLSSSVGLNLLIDRYGAGWIYIPAAGFNPKEEEDVVLDLFRQPLRNKVPSSWVDIRDLVTRYKPQLGNTGFPPDATLNLLFHAALRLTEQEKLESLIDKFPPPEGESSNYGRRRFIIPPDAEISLGTLLCDRCRDEYDSAYMILHYECAGRLRKALTKVLSRRKAG
jgi:hypothetical protein